MSEKKHIDRLFQEKFKDFEVSPRAGVWKNIERELKGKKPRRRLLIPFWYRIAGSAAMLAFLIWMGSGLFDNPSKDIDKTNIANEQPPADTESTMPEIEAGTNTPAFGEKNDNAKEGLSTEAVLSSGNDNSMNGGIGDRHQNDKPKNALSAAGIVSTNDEINSTNKKTNIPERNSNLARKKSDDSLKDKLEGLEGLASNRNNEKSNADKDNKPSFDQGEESLDGISSVASNKKLSPKKTLNGENDKEIKETGKKSLLAEAKKQEAFAKAMASEGKQNNSTDAVAQNKWVVQPFAAPIYYNGGNAIDPKFDSNPNEGDMTMAFGVNIAYQISDKIKIRSGIGQVTVSNSIEGIAFASAVAPTALANVVYSPQAEDLRIEKANNVFVPPGNEVQGRMIPFSNGVLNQQMGYIEVPLEIEYSIIDKKFGLSVIGGGSTLFLNQNNISINSAQGTTNIGQANNLNKTSFSTNIGLGLGYEISKRFELSLEPTFKYQFNTFSEAVDFNPYYFGVFTGISFKF